MKILFCVNAGAGPDKGPDWRGLIRDHFKGRPEQIHLLELGDDREQELRRALKTKVPDRVVAVGGDGTVNFVASILGGTGIPMGLIPAGSANGLATDLQWPTEPEAIFELIRTGRPCPMDAILVNDQHLCVHLADLGMNAQMIKHFDETPARGMLTYARLSLKVLLNKARFKVHVKSDKGELLRVAFMVVLANARKYGTGATINKEGDLSDGVFEVIVVRSFGLRELWDSIIERRRFDPKRIEVLQAREVEIITGTRAHFQIDGDHKGKVRSVKARILKGHLLMIASAGVLGPG
jgi:diacylglycerol kinase (ATP)